MRKTPQNLNQNAFLAALLKEIVFGTVVLKVIDGKIETIPLPRMMYLRKPFCRGHSPSGHAPKSQESIHFLLHNIGRLRGAWTVTVKVVQGEAESWSRERNGVFAEQLTH